MPRTRIKICGVRDIETALVAADAGADAIGLVFVESSPRYFEDEYEAFEVVQALPPFVEAVGLFADETGDAILEKSSQVGFHTVQLHGNETEGDVVVLTEAGLKVIKAKAFTGESGDDDADGVMPMVVDAMLWDSPPADQGGGVGGTGRAFDWKAFARVHPRGRLKMARPVILAGGLTPENVGEAMSIVRPYAVDVSSGVERSRGVKDAMLIRRFCNAVRAADAKLVTDARR